MDEIKYRFNDKATRKIIIRLAELAKQYKEPYDDMDREARAHNAKLNEKWKEYVDFLEDLAD